MSLKIDKSLSLRTRLILGSTLSTGAISLITGTLIISISIHYHLSRITEELETAIDVLAADYNEHQNVIDDFTSNADMLVHKLNPKYSILLTDAHNQLIYASSMPERIRNRILRNSTTRSIHRFYTKLGSSHNRHMAVRFLKCDLPDGNHLIVAKDTTDTEHFLWFLAITLCASLVLIMILTAVSETVFGTKFIKRLRKITAAADDIRRGDLSRRVGPLDTHTREIKELGEAFDDMCRQNEQTMHELRSLTDNLAHDLRTPLTRLRLAAETAALGGTLREPLPEQVEDETTSMLEFINTMLEISQTDARIFRSPREQLDLTDLVARTIELYQPLATQEGIALKLELPPTPVLFSGHRSKLQQLLGNLIDNAIKFTPKGGRIEVKLAAPADEVLLSVADSGMGIAEADLPHVFERFWRADSSRSLPGNGLGLALVKAIATSYGGKVKVDSKPACGTTFTVALPS